MKQFAPSLLVETKNDIIRLREKATNCPPKNRMKFESLITVRWNNLERTIERESAHHLKKKIEYQLIKQLIYGKESTKESS